jgi:hypothetical protein
VPSSALTIKDDVVCAKMVLVANVTVLSVLSVSAVARIELVIKMGPLMKVAAVSVFVSTLLV